MESRPEARSPLGLLDVVVMFFFWLVGQAASISLIALIFGVGIEELSKASGETLSWATILIASGQMVATLVAVGVLLIRYRQLSIIGWQPQNFRGDLRIGLMAFAMVVPSILFLQWLLVQVFAYQHPTMELLEKNANGLTLLATWFSAVIVAPICEEVFFRGVLQSWLQRVGGGISDLVLTGGWDSPSNSVAVTVGVPMPTDSSSTGGSTTNKTCDSPGSLIGKHETADSIESSWTSNAILPILITSALFGLAHSGQGPAPIPLFVFGIVLGYLFRRTGSIVPCIALHMLLNAFSMFWFTLQVFLSEPDPSAILEPVRGVIGIP